VKSRTTLLSIGAAFSVFLTLVFSTVAFSKTIYVDDDATSYGSGTRSDPYRWIRTAIYRASPGDIVYVRPGTYRERIWLKNGVALLGSGSNRPVIDGAEYGTVVTAIGIGANSEFMNFKVVNGSSSEGAGMFINNSSLVVRNCVFENNQTTPSRAESGQGGGMYITDSSPVIEHCDFRNNHAGWGGGVEIKNANPEFYGCTFSGNKAYTHAVETHDSDYPKGNGGAMHILGLCSPTVIECEFVNNNAKENGGAIWIENYVDTWREPYNLRIENCIFDGNEADRFKGGAISVGEGKGRTFIYNSTFWRNRAMYGGGISAVYGADTIVTYCTFYGNYSGRRDEGGALYSGGGDILVWNSIIWRNGYTEVRAEGYSDVYIAYSNVEGSLRGVCSTGSGNIDEPPLFVDPEDGDFHLQPDSPCIDAGRWISYPEYDIDGDDRIINDHSDMGVDEYNPDPSPSYYYDLNQSPFK
jgi:hypothetical protein